MSCDMRAEPCFETALLADFFQYLVATAVTRYWEHTVIPCQPLVLFNDSPGDFQQANVGFRVGFLSSGNNPQIAVKECLQVIGG